MTRSTRSPVFGPYVALVLILARRSLRVMLSERHSGTLPNALVYQGTGKRVEA